MSDITQTLQGFSVLRQVLITAWMISDPRAGVQGALLGVGVEQGHMAPEIL